MSISNLFRANSYLLYNGSLQSGSIQTGAILCTGNTESTATNAGTVIIGGGIGVGKNGYFGGDLNVHQDITVDGIIHGDLDGNIDATNLTITNDMNTPSISLSNGNIMKDFTISTDPSAVLTYDGALNLSDTTPSTSVSTGCLTIAGGAGINGTVYIANDLHVNNSIYCPSIVYENKEVVQSTIDSTSTDTGASIVSGGCGIAKRLNVGGVTTIEKHDGSDQLVLSYIDPPTDDVNVKFRCSQFSDLSISPSVAGSMTYLNSLLTVVSTNQAAISTQGGVKVYKGIDIGETAGQINQRDTTDSTNTASGSIVCAGGIGIGKSAYIGELHTNKGYFNQAVDSPQIILNNNEIVPVHCDLKATNDANLYISSSAGPDLSTVHIQSGLSVDATGNSSVAIQGGAIIEKALDIKGICSVLNTTESVDLTTGAFISSGGISVKKNAHIKGTLYADSGANSTDVFSGALIVNGGIGAIGSSYLGLIDMQSNANSKILIKNQLNEAQIKLSTLFGESSLKVDDNNLMTITPADLSTPALSIKSTADSTDIITGSLQISGGIGVAKSAYIGGITHIVNTTASTSTDSGSLQILGGTGIGGHLYAANITAEGLGNQLTITRKNVGSAIISVDTSGDMFTDLSGPGLNQYIRVPERNIFTSTIESTSSTNGSVIISGGTAIKKNLNVGGSSTVASLATNSINSITGNLGIFSSNAQTNKIAEFNSTDSASINKLKILSPDGTEVIQLVSDQGNHISQLYATKPLEIWGNENKCMTVDNTAITNIYDTKITSTTASTSSSSGSLVVAGGIGCSQLYGTVYSRDYLALYRAGTSTNAFVMQLNNNITLLTPRNRSFNLFALVKSTGASNYSQVGTLPLYGYEFNNLTSSDMKYSVAMGPDVYQTDTNAVITINWAGVSGALNGFIHFQFNYAFATVSAQLPNSLTAVDIIASYTATAPLNRRVSSVAFTLTGLTKGTLLYGTFGRVLDASDTYAGSIWVTNLVIQMQSSILIGDSNFT